MLDNIIEDEESKFLSLGLFGRKGFHECLRAESLDHLGDECRMSLHNDSEALSACNLELVLNFHLFFVHGSIIFSEFLAFVRVLSELFLLLLRLIDAFERLLNKSDH